MSNENDKEVSGASLDNISSATNKKLSDIKLHEYKDLPDIFQHLVEHKAINIIPLKPGTKEPKLSRWKPYQNRQYPLKALQRHKGNFAVITGENNPGTGWYNLVVLDIDDKEGENGLYRHFKDVDTLQVKTPLKGYHLYFWTQQPVEDKDYLSKVFGGLDIEVRGKRQILCTLPPATVIYPDEGNYIGTSEVIKTGSNYPIMELEDPEDFIREILVKAGYTADDNITKDIPTDPTPGVIRDGTWTRKLNEAEVKTIVRLLKPIYTKGNRQKLTLYVSGWMYKAEIDPESALSVVKLLTDKDKEQSQRITALKNSYRGLEETSIKGSGGVYELLDHYYTTKHKDIENKEDRVAKIEEDTLQHYRNIKKIIVHPHSTLGVRNYLKVVKEGGKGQTRAIKKIHQFLRARHHIIKDSVSGEIAIYNHDKGYYEFHDDDKFQEFLLNVFQEEIFTKEEARKLKSIFAYRKEQEQSHIVFSNGILNLETLELEDFTPDYFLNFKVPYNWNPEAKGGFVKQKLQEILIDQQGNDEGNTNKYTNYLELVGYVLGEPGNPRQKIFLYVGDPGSGKTQLINLLTGLVEEGASSVPLQQFKDRFGLQGLIGKRINTLYDISEEEINDPSVIKAVSGSDSITIDRKFKESVTFQHGLPVKTIGAGNTLPKIKDETQAMARRLNITKVKNDFTDKPVLELSEKLLSDSEGVEWLIATGIQKYHEMKEQERPFTLDATPKEIQLEYLKLSDPCRYAMECLYEFSNNENDFYTSTELITSINKFLETEGLRIPKDTRHNHHPAIRSINGEYTKRRVAGDLEGGYTLIKARLPDKDPKKTRLDTNTLIRIKPEKRRELMTNTTDDDELQILESMEGLTAYNLKGLQTEAKEHYGISKDKFMEVIHKWKTAEVLEIDNTLYMKE